MNTEQQLLQLVTFEQAKQLKEAGFDWGLDIFYTKYGDLENDKFFGIKNWNDSIVFNRFSAPTVALALKWFRDVKGISSSEGVRCNLKYEWEYFFKNRWRSSVYNEYDTYEDAESALLDELLTLV